MITKLFTCIAEVGGGGQCKKNDNFNDEHEEEADDVETVPGSVSSSLKLALIKVRVSPGCVNGSNSHVTVTISAARDMTMEELRGKVDEAVGRSVRVMGIGGEGTVEGRGLYPRTLLHGRVV